MNEAYGRGGEVRETQRRKLEGREIVREHYLYSLSPGKPS